ncbi:PREDICTED: ubiquinol-cytochrome-c reductase complex assembly factor 2-like [Priapulus caudatus]|uniref:Mitochondrial nucleoid factor 1 n=1 Tax=Priapulus caudatus TaxID=37621 RepID=A0ABM1F0R0_PRICU|nr:PREDICTED: ubiquinol-cytochrome-c reductase complex assembly factor 2-like [Priapulus caudatus]
MAFSQYRKFVRLLEMWPVDNSKFSRDLGQHIRNKVAETFREGETTKIANAVECDKYYDALMTLALNKHKDKYQVKFQEGTASTGLTLEECHLLMATESLQIIDKENRRWWQAQQKSEQKKKKTGK